MLKSTSSFQGTDGEADNKAYLIGHFMREFDAKDAFPENDDKEDIVLTNDDKLLVDVNFVVSGLVDKKGYVEIKSPLGPTTGPTCAAGASGAMHLTSLVQMTLVSSLLLAITNLF